MTNPITIDPLVLAFVVEALTLALAVLAAVLWLWHRHRHREHDAARRLVERLRKTLPGQGEELNTVLGEIAALADEQRDEFIEAVLSREKALYRHVLRLFLEQDGRLLSRLEQQVRALTEPYRELLRDLPGGGNEAEPDPRTDEELRLAREQIRRLESENEELARQLQIAMETIESLSSEYTRMFAPDRTGAELEQSRRRILETLRASQRRLQRVPETPDDEDIVIVEGNG